mgnify:CR=1
MEYHNICNFVNYRYLIICLILAGVGCASQKAETKVKQSPQSFRNSFNNYECPVSGMDTFHRELYKREHNN